ncbi:response regulator transcription factor [Pirellulaceae bacterium SH449]
MSKSILLIDDHEIARLGLKQILEGSQLQVTAEASDSSAALECLSGGEFALLVIDPKLPSGDGFSLIQQVIERAPEQNTLLFSELESPPLSYYAISLGMKGLICKSSPPSTIVDGLTKVAAGESLWTKEEIRKSSRLGVSNTILETKSGVPLTKRESDVLSKMATGMTNREIAKSFGISYETVKEHVQHILRKIGVSDRTQAAVWAVHHRLI